MRIGSLDILERTVIGDGPLGPLLIRYKILKCPLFGLCVHKLCRSDYERALHDHPWPFVSIVLSGGYTEVTTPDPGATVLRGLSLIQNYRGEWEAWNWRPRFSVAYRGATHRHRVVLSNSVKAAWTLMLMGPRVRRWGFWLPDGWCWWRRHNHDLNICEDDIVHGGGGD